MSFTVFTEFYRDFVNLNGLCCVLFGLHGFLWVFTGFYWFSLFYWPFLFSTGFLQVNVLRMILSFVLLYITKSD